MNSRSSRNRYWARASWGAVKTGKRVCGLLFIAVCLSGGLAAQTTVPAVRSQSAAKKPISAAEFSRMVRLFSEEGGSFFSDNWVSNETAYLHVMDKLKQLDVSGGAYIGVGPEQNFSYIAHIRPEIAFIVDIRRQAIIQHLMYKAVFQLAANREQFLSMLLSRPLDGKDSPGHDAPLEAVLNYFGKAPVSEKRFAENLTAIRATIEKDFGFSISPEDAKSLEYVYGAFKNGGLGISFRFGPGDGGAWYGGFPTFANLMLETDQHGKLGSFLASDDDYNFVRNLHRKNRIIPVVGDFGGKKALAVVGDYLRENGYTVSAYYTSNVEQFLYGDQIYGAFVDNIRKLPLDEHSVFIRALRAPRGHPGAIPGHRMTTMLQKMQVFLKDYDQGLFPDYWSLTSKDFITANEP